MSSVLIGPEPVVAHGLVRTFGARRVLDGLDLTVAPGTRLGLIGENGTGKSTLLRLLAGRDVPDEGAVQVPRDLVYLPQETWSGLTEHADRGARPSGQEPEVGRHSPGDAAQRSSTIRTVGDMLDDALRPLHDAVASPTNHLDDEALDLLEASLLELPGVVVAASHDRTFLDRVATELVDLDAGVLGTDGRGGRRFGGSFGEYLAAQADSRRRWEETFAAQQEEIAALRERTHLGLRAVAAGRGPTDNDKFVHKFTGGGVERARARRVHDAERRLEVAEREALPKPPPRCGSRGR